MARFICAALAAITFAVTGTAFGQSAQAGPPGVVPDGKIAVVKADVFPEKINELKQKYDQVDEQFKPRFDKVKTMADRMKEIESELSGIQQSSTTADKLRQLQSEYESLQRQGTREETDLRDEIGRVLDAAASPIEEKLAKFMAAFATQRNIVAVFNLNGAADTGLFAFFNPGTDITDDFVAEYNKANPVPEKAAPSKP